jgi:hypothetical protein
MERWSWSAWRARWWALRALRAAQREVRQGGFDASQLPPPPQLGDVRTPAVAGMLRRRKATCLTRSLVLQRWHAAHGSRRDLIIGVTAPKEGFTAHAWLAGDPDDTHAHFHELTRQPAPE